MNNKNLTPEQELNLLILHKQAQWDKLEFDADSIDIDKEYELQREDGGLQDAEEEVRCSGEFSEISCEYSRNYETESHAKKTLSGKWVGWTYYYGGGKHSEPSAIDWKSDAYFLDCEEKEVTVIQRTFKKQDNA
jgi:hypothetical protein